MYTIKQAAQRTGVSEATLRAWERRYQVVAPRRTDGGYRVYDDDAVRALTLMNGLVAEGWAPRHAAEEVRRRATGAAPAAPAPAPPAAEPVDHGAEPGVDGDADTTALLAAAAALDAAAVAEVLDRRFAVGTFEAVVDTWLMPALTALGLAWAEGRVSVAGEHLVAYAVQRRLSAIFEASAARLAGPRVLVGLPPGARHELGVLAFAAASRRAGLATAYLGADLPVDDWVSAVDAHDASAVVLAAVVPEDVAPLEEVVAALRARRPDLLVAVGGAHAPAVGAPCLRLDDRIGPAASTLAREAGRV